MLQQQQLEEKEFIDSTTERLPYNIYPVHQPLTQSLASRHSHKCLPIQSSTVNNTVPTESCVLAITIVYLSLIGRGQFSKYRPTPKVFYNEAIKERPKHYNTQEPLQIFMRNNGCPPRIYGYGYMYKRAPVLNICHWTWTANTLSGYPSRSWRTSTSSHGRRWWWGSEHQQQCRW